MQPARIAVPLVPFRQSTDGHQKVPAGSLTDWSNRLVVSAASGWEVATKHRIGRLREAEAVVLGYKSHLEALGAEELAIRSSHALLAGELRQAHRDPFDRMLAAQAVLESLPLVTADPVFAQFPVSVLW